MTLLPFTLEAWRSGLQPCTLQSIEVTDLGTFARGLAGYVEGEIHAWAANGVHSIQALLDLRLRPKTEKRWVIVYRDNGIETSTVGPFQPVKAHNEIGRGEIEVPVP